MPLPILGARLKLIDPGVLRRQNARMPVHCGPHLGHLLFNAGIYLCVIERSVADGLPTWKFGVWRTQERLNGAAREACVLLCPSRRAAPIGPISHRCLSSDCSICDAAVPSDFAPWCGLVGFLLTDRIDRSSKGGKCAIVAPVSSTILQSFWLSNRCCPANRVVRDKIPATCYSSETGPAMERGASS